MSKRRNPYAPRVYLNRTTQQWSARCWVCKLTTGATFWNKTLEDVGRHLATPAHAAELALAKAAKGVAQ